MAEATGSASTGRRSFGELVADLPRLLTELIRAEIDALRAELTRSAIRAAVGIGLLVAAVTLLFLMLVTLVAAAVAGLAVVLPVWAAALIVAGGLLLIAGLLVWIGIVRLKTAGPDIATRVESITEDIRAIKGEAPRAPEGSRDA